MLTHGALVPYDAIYLFFLTVCVCVCRRKPREIPEQTETDAVFLCLTDSTETWEASCYKVLSKSRWLEKEAQTMPVPFLTLKGP